MSAARERIQAYLDRIDAQNAKSSLKYHDTIHGLDDIELTRTDLRALLAETAEPHTFDTDECVTRECKCAPTEDVRGRLAQVVSDSLDSQLPEHERSGEPTPVDEDVADAILAAGTWTPKEEQ